MNYSFVKKACLGSLKKNEFEHLNKHTWLISVDGNVYNISLAIDNVKQHYKHYKKNNHSNYKIEAIGGVIFSSLDGSKMTLKSVLSHLSLSDEITSSILKKCTASQEYQFLVLNQYAERMELIEAQR